MTLASKGRSAAKGRSAVTNGRKPFLTRTTRKTPEYRRLKDLLDQLYKDHGGLENLSIEKQICAKVLAGWIVQQEITLGKLAAGEAVDVSDLTRISNALDRARRAMGDPPSKRPTARRGRIVSITSGAGAPPIGETSP